MSYRWTCRWQIKSLIQKTSPLNNNKGFTTVKIMIVVSFLGMLAAIAIPNFVQARNSVQVNTTAPWTNGSGRTGSKMALPSGWISSCPTSRATWPRSVQRTKPTASTPPGPRSS
jgi:Tfp pilus assembly protein FimT